MLFNIEMVMLCAWLEKRLNWYRMTWFTDKYIYLIIGFDNQVYKDRKTSHITMYVLMYVIREFDFQICIDRKRYVDEVNFLNRFLYFNKLITSFLTEEYPE